MTPEQIEIHKKLEAELYRIRLDPKKDIERPPSILSVVERRGTTSTFIPVFSLGDLSLIQGRQKSKKTFFTASLVSQMLNNDSFDKLHAEPPEGTTIAVFDTEQSNYYAQLTNRRINKLSNSSQEYYYFPMREKNPTQRKELIEFFIRSHKGKISLVLIDGIVDLLFDFNDLKECIELVQWIMTLTKEYNIHCLCVLHENQGDGKARGHIGTLLAQKAESVLRIEKNAQDFSRSTIKAKDTRGKQFMDFDIVIDHEGIPHLTEKEEQSKVF